MKTLLLKWTLWIVFAGILTGCSGLPPLPPPTAPSPLQEITNRHPQLTNSDYTLGPEDVLRITVYEHPDLSQDVSVSPHGTFAYPLLGDVQAAGLTVQQLEAQMRHRLSADYLVDPQVSVTVTQYRNRHVYVLGAVRSPGRYPVQHQTTLLELLSAAGGLTDDARWYALLVQATEGSNGAMPNAERLQDDPAAMRIDLEKLMSGEVPQPILLASGDTIFVPKSGFFFVSGEVQRPGRYPLQRDMTVMQALIEAGGLSKFAVKGRLRVRRMLNGQPQEFRARMHDFLQPNDVLIVPQSIF